MHDPSTIPFQQLLDALLDESQPLSPRYLYRLSDLEEPELGKLTGVWGKIPVWRRKALLEDVEELGESDTLLNFVALGRLAARDQDAGVRLLAVRALWDYEDHPLASFFLEMLESEKDAGVKAVTAGALGRFVYAGEIDELPAQTLHRIEDALLRLAEGPDSPDVRRAALEALGYSSRKEVPALIEKAYASQDRQWVASALFAMSRSANAHWQPQVLGMLDSPHPALRCEAARAAGELELPSARPKLLELLDDPDDDTRLAAIWSLSQIGGEGVREALEGQYEQAEESQEVKFLESALDNLEFNEGLGMMPMFDFPEKSEDLEGESKDLEELEDDLDFDDDEGLED